LKKVVLSFLLLVGIGFADDYKNGTNAYDKKDFKTALRFFQKACHSGDAHGCAMIGLMYHGGVGAKQDIFKAVELFSKACEGGDTAGCYALGMMNYCQRRS
jgi:uncharacterized protein